MKNKNSLTILSLIIGVGYSLLQVVPVWAVAPYPASDLLGQYSSGTPDYDSSAINGPDGPAANTTGLYRPNNMAIDPVGHRLFVADSSNNRVLVHNLDANNTIIDETADNVLGQAGFTSATSATTQSGMDAPHGVAYDSDTDFLYVADSNNNRVLVFDAASITNGENASNVIGQPDFTSSGSAVTQDQLSSPEDVVVDTANNRLFVADYTNSRVLIFNVTSISNGMNASNVIGQPDFTTLDTGTTASTFFFVDAIAYDSSTERLFVADGLNDRIMIFDVSTVTDGMNASSVLGASNLTSAGSSSASQSAVSLSRGMTIDESNQLLFAKDTAGSRVMVFDIGTVVNNEAAIAVIGQANFTDSYVTAYGQDYVGYDGGLLYDSASNGLFVSEYDEHRITYFSLVRLTTSSLNSATKDEAFSQQLGKAGDTGTTSFAVTSGSLPSGMTLSSSGLLSGTPTQSGIFNFTVQLDDDNTTAGTLFDTKSYTITVSDPSADGDGDGISDAEETAGPNGGDANGDGTQDSSQAGVGYVTNVVTAQPTVVELDGGTLTNFTTQDENSLPTPNPDADFPVGLNSFEATGLAPGATVNVTVYYDKVYDTSDWTYMKYSTDTDEFTDMSSAVTYATAAIGSNQVTTVSYSITDGGQWDEDGTANGTIVDPAGPALLGATTLAPDTGYPASSMRIPVVMAALGVVGLLVALRPRGAWGLGRD